MTLTVPAVHIHPVAVAANGAEDERDRLVAGRGERVGPVAQEDLPLSLYRGVCAGLGLGRAGRG